MQMGSYLWLAMSVTIPCASLASSLKSKRAGKFVCGVARHMMVPPHLEVIFC